MISIANGSFQYSPENYSADILKDDSYYARLSSKVENGVQIITVKSHSSGNKMFEVITNKGDYLSSDDFFRTVMGKVHNINR